MHSAASRSQPRDSFLSRIRISTDVPGPHAGLSRAATIIAQSLSEPDVFRVDPGSVQGLSICQATSMTDESLHLVIDGRMLLVGTDDVFALAPQRIHRIQLRRPLRQPQTLDGEFAGQ